MSTSYFKSTLSEKENAVYFGLSHLKLSVNSKFSISFLVKKRCPTEMKSLTCHHREWFAMTTTLDQLWPVVMSWNINCVFTNALSEHLIKGHVCSLISGRKGDCNIFHFKYKDSIDCSDAHCFIILFYIITRDDPFRIILNQDVSYQWDCHIKIFTIRANVRRISWVDLGFIFFSHSFRY